MSSTFGDSDILVTIEGAKVEDSTWLVVEQDGEAIGHIAATFDFKEMPGEHHGLCMQLIQQQRHRLVLPSKLPPPEPDEDSTSKPWWKFW